MIRIIGFIWFKIKFKAFGGIFFVDLWWKSQSIYKKFIQRNPTVKFMLCFLQPLGYPLNFQSIGMRWKDQVVPDWHFDEIPSNLVQWRQKVPLACGWNVRWSPHDVRPEPLARGAWGFVRAAECDISAFCLVVCSEESEFTVHHPLSQFSLVLSWENLGGE